MVYYEWDIEEVDEYGDILDHNFQNRLKDFDLSILDSEQYRLVLVRNTVDECEGLIDRQWAYAVKSAGKWVLPGQFDGGARVPMRFIKELKILTPLDKEE